MSHSDKMRARIAEKAHDAQIMRDYTAELAAQGKDKAAAKVWAKGEEYEAEAKFLRGRLRKL